jgi:hypothetical protein
VARQRTHAKRASQRARRRVDGTRVCNARGLTNTNWRNVGRSTPAIRVVWNVELVLYLAGPPIRTGVLPASCVRVKVPLRDVLPKLERTVVLAPSARRQRRGIKDPAWNRARDLHDGRHRGTGAVAERSAALTRIQRRGSDGPFHGRTCRQ